MRRFQNVCCALAPVLSTVLALTLGAAPAVAGAGGVAPGGDQRPTALVGATLVDGTGAAPVPGAVVVVEGGRIACAGSPGECPVPDRARIRELSDRWIVPGLVDTHVHFSQTGWADGRPDSLDVRGRYPYPEVVDRLEDEPERFLRAHLCSGTTSVFDVGGYPWTLRLPVRADAAEAAPRVRAAGPLVSTWDFWLNLPGEKQFLYLADRAAARDQVSYLAARGAAAVKVWYIGTDERAADEMVALVRSTGAEAAAHDLPLIVHATALERAKSAVRAGAGLLVHSVGDRRVDDEFLRLARDAGTAYCPTLTVGRGYQAMDEAAFAAERPPVDDPNGCIDPATLARVAETAELGELVRRDGLTAQRLEARESSRERRARIEAANLAAVHRAGIPVVLGTDAGNPLTLHGPSVYAELEAMEAAGLAPMDVLVAATRNGARALGVDDETGTVEAGKTADLVILAADPTASARAFRSIRAVVRDGIIHDIDSLSHRTEH